jgi:lipoic acid synthetase
MGSEYTAPAECRDVRGPAHGVPGGRLPNIFECWVDREATLLSGGDQCTRLYDFCQMDSGKPEPVDRDEPRHVAESGCDG